MAAKERSAAALAGASMSSARRTPGTCAISLGSEDRLPCMSIKNEHLGQARVSMTGSQGSDSGRAF